MIELKEGMYSRIYANNLFHTIMVASVTTVYLKTHFSLLSNVLYFLAVPSSYTFDLSL